MTKKDWLKNFKDEFARMGFYISYDKRDKLFSCENEDYFCVKKIVGREEVAVLHAAKFEYESLISSMDNLYFQFDAIDTPITRAIPKLFFEEDEWIFPTNNFYKKEEYFFDDFLGDNRYLYYISKLSVAEEYKGIGIGTMLVKFFLNYIVSGRDSNLILTYPFCLDDYDSNEHCKIVNFWHKQGFCPIYKTNPVFYFNQGNYKYDKELFNKLKYK